MHWCLEEHSAYADHILDRLRAGDNARVPLLWLYEVVSVLVKFEQKGTLTAEKARSFLEDLRSLDVIIDLDGIQRIFGDVYKLALEQKLSGYDASYLELALRRSYQSLRSPTRLTRLQQLWGSSG